MSTPIVFEPYTGGDHGSGSGQIKFAALGAVGAVAGSGGLSFRAGGTGVIPVHGSGHGALRFGANSGQNRGGFTLRSNGYVAPIIPEIIVGAGAFSFAAHGVGTYIGEGQGAISFYGRQGNAGGFSFDSFGLQTQHFVGGISVGQSPGYLRLRLTDGRIVVVESMFLRSRVKVLPIFTIIEELNLGPRMTAHGHMKNVLRDVITLGDMVSLVWKLLVQEHLAMAPTMTPSLKVAARIAEVLRLVAGHPTTHLAARNAVAAALVLGDKAGFNFKEIVQEHLELTDSMKAKLAAHAKVIDEIVLGATQRNTVTFSAVVKEDLKLTDTAIGAAQLRAVIQENLYLSAILNLDDDVQAAWVVNTLNKASTEYSNFPFNSFFELNGKFYGVAETGLYELTGTDDAGQSIESFVRTGLTNLGTGKMKRTPSAYVGFTSDGTIVFKAVTTSPEGEKVENWYELTPVTANVTREGRIRLGRGMESVYWQYEVHSLTGAPFSLNTLELYPVILERRIRSN